MHRLLFFRLFRCRLCGPDIVVDELIFNPDELIFNPDELEIEVFLECFCCFLSVTNFEFSLICYNTTSYSWTECILVLL